MLLSFSSTDWIHIAHDRRHTCMNGGMQWQWIEWFCDLHWLALLLTCLRHHTVCFGLKTISFHCTEYVLHAINVDLKKKLEQTLEDLQFVFKFICFACGSYLIMILKSEYGWTMIKLNDIYLSLTLNLTLSLSPSLLHSQSETSHIYFKETQWLLFIKTKNCRNKNVRL